MTDRLQKQETVALWHAIGWMDTCLREWRRDHPNWAANPQYVRQAFHLQNAKRALRKVNKLRKQGL